MPTVDAGDSRSRRGPCSVGAVGKIAYRGADSKAIATKSQHHDAAAAHLRLGDLAGRRAADDRHRGPSRIPHRCADRAEVVNRRGKHDDNGRLAAAEGRDRRLLTGERPDLNLVPDANPTVTHADDLARIAHTFIVGGDTKKLSVGAR
jgi:hypothetical protein